MKTILLLPRWNSRGARWLAFGGSLALLISAVAQPTVLSTVPANAATGVSPSAAVIFTFSAAMDTTQTSAQFLNSASPMTPLAMTVTWNAGDTVMTCTPNPPFPANTMIAWTLDGQDTAGNSLEGNTFGYFMTGSSSGGGGGGGSGTNQVTTASVGKIYYYDQNSASTPTLDPTIAAAFVASTTLASNQTATAVTLTYPGGATTNLSQNPTAPEDYFFDSSGIDPTVLETAFPNGNYTFALQQSSGSQSIPINFPASLVQPDAPHISNYAAAQAVDPTQPFTLTWDVFQGGTASDYIQVDVGGTLFKSPAPGNAGALTGTDTAFVIPANTLETNQSYDVEVTFGHTITNQVDAADVSAAFRATITQFTLITTGGGVAPAPVIQANTARYSAGVFSFAVGTSAGQTITVEYSSTLAPGSWTPLLTTNSPGSQVLISDPQAGTQPYRFYRVHSGP